MENQLGHLVLNEDGAVISSGGELENGESVAQIIINLINMTETIDPSLFPKNSCRKISIVYDGHSYECCLSNRKVYVYKKKLTHLNQPAQTPQQSQAQAENLVDL